MKKRIAITCLATLVVLSLAAPAVAQNKMQKCGHIRLAVDVNEGSGWKNDVYELALQEEGGGWVILEGEHQGQNVPAKKGHKLRFNFNDGAKHMINVNASTKTKSAAVKAGSRPAISLVDVTGNSGSTMAVHFDITGSPNPKAKIGGCPGGNFYISVQ